MNNRKGNLTSYSLKKYLIASVLSLAIMNLNATFDGIITGNLLGSNAFSAVNLSLPVISILTIFTCLVVSGAALLAAQAIGTRDKEAVKSIFSISIMSIILVGVIMLLTAFFGLDYIVEIVCVDKTLFSLTKDYCFIILACGFIFSFQIGLSEFTSSAGFPKIVTRSSIANLFTNITMDVVYVKYLNLGIKGAALASVTATVVSIIIYLSFLRKPESPYCFCLKISNKAKILYKNLLNGFPIMIQTLSLMFLIFLSNLFVQKALGTDGIFVFSIVINFLSVCSIVTSGASLAYISMGGILLGQNDITGVRILSKKTTNIVLISAIIFTLFIVIFPHQIGVFYGADNGSILSLMSVGSRITAFFIIPLQLITLVLTIYQVLDHIKMIIITSIIMVTFIPISLVCFYKFFPAEYFWFSFPCGGFAILVGVAISAQIYRKVVKKDLTGFLLIEKTKNDTQSLDISVKCDKKSIIESLKMTDLFFNSLSCTKKDSENIRHCIEEMMLLILSHKKDKSYMDIIINGNENAIIATIRDNGLPFDPVNTKEIAMELSIIKAKCDEISYMYSLGQNMTFLKWNRNEGSVVNE